MGDHEVVPYYVYILASERNGTLYTGVTNDLTRRVFEHKTGVSDGFTRKYNVKSLVYFETHSDIGAAFAREHTLKRWRRRWKLELIERNNANWRDLFENINS